MLSGPLRSGTYQKRVISDNQKLTCFISTRRSLLFCLVHLACSKTPINCSGVYVGFVVQDPSQTAGSISDPSQIFEWCEPHVVILASWILSPVSPKAQRTTEPKETSRILMQLVVMCSGVVCFVAFLREQYAVNVLNKEHAVMLTDPIAKTVM